MEARALDQKPAWYFIQIPELPPFPKNEQSQKLLGKPIDFPEDNGKESSTREASSPFTGVDAV